MDQLKIFLRVETGHARPPRRRRFARDEVIVPRSGLQKVAAIFNVHLEPRITKRVCFTRINNVAQFEEVARNFNDVDRFERLNVGDCAGRHAGPKTDNESALQVGANCCRPVGVQTHVALRKRAVRRH